MSGEERRPKSGVISTEPSPGEVEELLRAAQDDLLLQLSVDTHTTSHRPTLHSFSAASSSLDPDLSRRFDALRSHQRDPPDHGAPPPPKQSAGGGGAARDGRCVGGADEVSNIIGDDLAARFAALKGSSSSYLPAGNVARKPAGRIHNDGDDDSDESDGDGDGVSKKEVEKLMQWAMDAARLGPDPSNSDDEKDIVGKEEEKGGGGESEQDDDEDDDAEARADDKKKEKKAEGKKPPARKWFFF